MTAEELRKNTEKLEKLNKNIADALAEFEVSISELSMEWVTMCCMSKSLVPALIFFFSVLSIYC